MQTAPHGSDRRSQTRMRCLKTGRVVLANGNSTLACRIRSQSDNGVRLVTDETRLIPETFALVQESAHGRKVSQTCKVAWRGHGEVGAIVVERTDDCATRRPPRKTQHEIISRYPV